MARAILEQIANIYQANALKTQALHDQAFMKMLNELPQDLQDIPIGVFLDRCEQDPNSIEAEWSNKPFTLNNDQQEPDETTPYISAES